MRPTGHAAISASLAVAVWAVTKSIPASVAAFVSGVFVDIDHLLDLVLLLRGRRRTRVIIAFHAWEWVPVLVVAAAMVRWNSIIIGIAVGLFGHLVADQLANRLPTLTYSIVFRASRNFRGQELDPFPVERFLDPLRRGVPFGNRLAEWVTRFLHLP